MLVLSISIDRDFVVEEDLRRRLKAEVVRSVERSEKFGDFAMASATPKREKGEKTTKVDLAAENAALKVSYFSSE